MDTTRVLRAIVRFKRHDLDPDVARPGKYFQVTIDPANLSPTGLYIRFDQSKQEGSELHGWQRVDDLEIAEELEVLADSAGVQVAA